MIRHYSTICYVGVQEQTGYLFINKSKDSINIYFLFMGNDLPGYCTRDQDVPDRDALKLYSHYYSLICMIKFV